MVLARITSDSIRVFLARRAAAMAPSLASGLVTGVCPWLPQLVPFASLPHFPVVNYQPQSHNPSYQPQSHFGAFQHQNLASAFPPQGHNPSFQSQGLNPFQAQAEVNAHYGQLLMSLQMLQQFAMPPSAHPSAQEPPPPPAVPTRTMTPPVPVPPPAPAPAPAPAMGSSLDAQLDADMANVFDDLDDDWALQPPSPHPLPLDFTAETRGPPEASSIPFLFNFNQFERRMVKAKDAAAEPLITSNNCYSKRSPTRSGDSGHSGRGPKTLPTNGSALDLNGLGATSAIDPLAFCFNPQEDGDLLHLVFGMAGEIPTMATTHLHMRPEGTQEEEEEEGELAYTNGSGLMHASDSFLVKATDEGEMATALERPAAGHFHSSGSFLGVEDDAMPSASISAPNSPSGLQ